MSEFDDELMQGLREAVEMERGNRKVHKGTFCIPAVKRYDCRQVRDIRNRAGMTQAMFADYLGVSVKTVEAWERGTNHPTGSACRLISVLEDRSMELKEILTGESKNLEFKVQRPKDSLHYMKSVVAFANGSGGRIVFGIEDETHKVVGIPRDIVFSEMDAITAAISDACEPAIVPDVYLRQIEDNTVIVVEIRPGRQRPYYIKSLGIQSGTYIRVAGISRPADRDLTTEMYYEGEGRSYDKVIRHDLTVPEEEIRRLCVQMKEVALKNARSQEQKADVKDVTKNQLLSWGLLDEGEGGKIHPTNGYLFLLGKDSFHSMIQCAVFKGKTRGIFVDKREYTGPLWEQVEEAHRFVLRNIHLGAKIVGVFRQDVYELPPDSIRELIINAVMNCSFLQNSHIQVAIYDDRLEITSPGGLLPGVTPARMREGYSKIRNKALANAFLYMNMIEEWGSGIPKLMREMREYGLREPEFIDMEIGFRVNLYRRQAEDSGPETDAERAERDKRKETGEKTGVRTDTKTGTKTRKGTDTKTDTKIPKGTDTKTTDTDTKANSDISKKTDTKTGNSTGTKAGAKTDTKTNRSSIEVNKGNDFDDTEKNLLDLIRENPAITLNEMTVSSGLSRSGVRYALNRLRRKGAVVREGSRKKGRWTILR